MPRARNKHGGTRRGQQGKAYPNRQDLNEKPRLPIQAASGQEYGKRGEQEAAQAVVPMGTPAVPPPGQSAPSFMTPDEVPTFGAPSQRPDEPVTAGLSFGPGRTPGPAGGVAPNPVNDDLIDQLRALYMQHPTRELRELIEEADL